MGILDNDPDWIAKYIDFVGQSDLGKYDWELNELDVFDECGLVEDIILDDFDFHACYESFYWNLLETKLVEERNNFTGPNPGPTCGETH